MPNGLSEAKSALRVKNEFMSEWRNGIAPAAQTDSPRSYQDTPVFAGSNPASLNPISVNNKLAEK
jgi:hypothetical protein